MPKFSRDAGERKLIAQSRVQTLFKEAESVFSKDPKLANRYVELARKIAMKVRLRLPSEFKRRFCKHCHAYLKPGVNCRVRLTKHKVVYSCFLCKHFMRLPYKTRLKITTKK